MVDALNLKGEWNEMRWKQQARARSWGLFKGQGSDMLRTDF